jgi:multisubunit Na+/H+ antiporter MnhF subunit
MMLLLMLPVAYRIAAGPSQAARLQAIEAFTSLLVAAIVLVALLQETVFFLDIAIALAALGFITTVGVARYMAEGKVF